MLIILAVALFIGFIFSERYESMTRGRYRSYWRTTTSISSLLIMGLVVCLWFQFGHHTEIGKVTATVIFWLGAICLVMVLVVGIFKVLDSFVRGDRLVENFKYGWQRKQRAVREWVYDFKSNTKDAVPAFALQTVTAILACTWIVDVAIHVYQYKVFIVH